MPKKSNLTPASFLYLGQDKNYTLDFGGFEFGKWEKHKDSIVLHAANGNTTTYPVNLENEKDLKMSISPGNIADFSGVASSFSSEKVNPFSLSNNRWRIPATHKESPGEIKERLLNHFTFWKVYFTWALDNNIQYIDVRSTPTPIKIYSNGFALKPFDDLPASWKQYFYDSADCRTANKMIDEIFTKQTIAWATTADKYKMFAGAFEQLQNYLKQQ